MIDTKALKQKILDLAIHGKLVPQDPSDEPASVLLEKIRTEKQRLIKEGKIKSDKSDSVIYKGDDNRYYEKIGNDIKDITKELDFDLPSGWEYVRLSSIGILGGGYTPKPNELDSSGVIPYFKVADMNTIGNEKYLTHTKAYLIKFPNKIYKKNSIVFPKNGGAVFTNKKRILAQDSVVDLNTGIFTPIEIDVHYAYILFLTIDFSSCYKGTALPTINSNNLNTILFGLPPFSEQKRIVTYIENLFKNINIIEDNQVELEQLYDKLKKKTLDLAIQGKLVPQDPNDEPASELLKRIRTEKKAQLGKKYVDSYIYKGDDNCYYEHIEKKHSDKPIDTSSNIPDNWAWAKMEDIAFVTKLAGFEYTKYIAPNLQKEGVPLFKGKNIQNSNIIYTFEGFIPEYVSDMLQRSQITKKCILTPYVGSIGNIGIHNKIGKYHLGSNVGKIELLYSNVTTEEFIVLYLRSSFGYSELTKHKKATAQESISIEAIRDIYIPLPPIDEQERIVDKLNELFSKL